MSIAAAMPFLWSMKPYIEIAEKTKADAMKTFEDAMSE